MTEKYDLNELYEEFEDGVPNLEQAFLFALDAIDRGDLQLGYAALGWVLQREPDNSAAWLWMACTVPEEERKRECYMRAEAALGSLIPH
jgi:hypothetical protein